VTMAAAVSLRGGWVVDNKHEGGQTMQGIFAGMETTTMTGGSSPAPRRLPQAAGTKATDVAMLPLARPLQPRTKLTLTTRTVDNTTRGEGQTTMTSNKSGWWMMQGDNDGGNNSSGDVVVLAVTRPGIGQHNESRQGRRKTW
jgi:hypothetical protein